MMVVVGIENIESNKKEKEKEFNTVNTEELMANTMEFLSAIKIST